MATDARVHYTKRVIRASFLELYKSKPMSQITVKDICEQAGINRATFYRHYADVYDLRDKIEDEIFQLMLALLQRSNLNNFHDTLLVILRTMKENQNQYVSLHEIPSGTLLPRIIRACFQEKEGYLRQVFPHYSEVEMQWYLNYICLGTAGIMIDWVKCGMQESPETVARFICDLIHKDSGK